MNISQTLLVGTALLNKIDVFQVVEKTLRFTMRDGACTLGYGVVTELLPEVNIDEFDEVRKKEKKAKEKAEQAAASNP